MVFTFKTMRFNKKHYQACWSNFILYKTDSPSLLYNGLPDDGVVKVRSSYYCVNYSSYTKISKNYYLF